MSGARVLVHAKAEDQYLIIRRTDTLWELPGGKIKADRSEPPGEAAVRELLSETGIRYAAAHLKYLGEVTVVYPRPDGLHAYPQHIFSAEIPCAVPALRNYRWVSLDQLLVASLQPEIQRFLQEKFVP